MGLADALERFDAQDEEKQKAEQEEERALRELQEVTHRHAARLGAEAVALCTQLQVPQAAKCTGERVPDTTSSSQRAQRVIYVFEEHWWDLGDLLLDPRGAFHMRGSVALANDPPGGWPGHGRPSDEFGSFETGQRDILAKHGGTRVITGAVRLSPPNALKFGGEWDPGFTLYVDVSGRLRRTQGANNFEDEVAAAIRYAVKRTAQ